MYCPHCGKEVNEDAVVCPHCGRALKEAEVVSTNQEPNNVLQLVAFILMVITTVVAGFFLIPLAWMIPMDVHLYKCMQEKKKVSVGFGVCTLIFVDLVSGILLLVDSAQQN